MKIFNPTHNWQRLCRWSVFALIGGGLLLNRPVAAATINQAPSVGQTKTATTTQTTRQPVAYDLSEWQRVLTPSQVQGLKKEVKFVILRGQYGSQHHDQVIDANAKLLSAAQIPFGVYSYSLYTDPTDAQNEAKSLYQHVSGARFYVNDCEENDTTNNTLAQSTIAWAQQMKRLTNKPVILYSGLSFMNQYLTTAQTSYSALWLADYTDYEPNPTWHYDLWQYTDRYYSAALGLNVDANVLPSGSKSLSYWLGTNQIVTKHQIKPATKKATYHPAVKKPTTTKKTATKKTPAKKPSTKTSTVTKKTTYHPVTKKTTYHPVVKKPVTKKTTYHPVTKKTTYHPVTKKTTYHPVTKKTTYHPVTKKTTYHPVTKKTTYHPVTKKTTYHPVTKKTTYHPIVKKTTHH